MIKSGNDSLLILAGLGLAATILTQGASAATPPECVDTTWTCDTTDRLEHSNCGNTRITTSCSLASDAAEMIAGTKAVDLRYDVNDDGIIDSSDVVLLKAGIPLRSLHPANITATTFQTPTVPSETYGIIGIDIIWKNLGEQSGSFVPQVIVSGGTPIDIDVQQTLAAKEVYHRVTTLTSIPPGSQTICPLPNPVVRCQTVDIPVCIDTTWTCHIDDGLEYSNCGNIRTTDQCTLATQAMHMIVDPESFPQDLRYDVNDNGFVDTGDATLLMEGTPLRDLHPSNITVISFPTPTIPSGTYNTLDIDITWANIGEVSGPFTPQVKIGGDILISLDDEIALDPKATYRRTIRLTDLPSGNQGICPIPE